MRTKYYWLVALAVMFGLASCDKQEDNPVVDVVDSSDVAGLWWAVYAEEGTTSGEAYSYVGQALRLEADGTGYAFTAYLSDSGEWPVGMRGGKSIAPFNYTVAQDGTLKLTFTQGFEADVEYYRTLVLHYADGRVNCVAGDSYFQMEPATAEEEVLIEGWDKAANGGADVGSTYNELRTNIDNAGERFAKNYSFRLEKYIDKYGPSGTKDYLKASGSIDLEFKVCPVYMQSANGTKAGDYYFVTCAVTPHNNSLWQPYVETHAWSKIRIYGFWMKDLDLAVSLVNEDGSEIQQLSYYERPIPENENDSKTYSSGKSISLSGTLSGGYQEEKGGNFGGSVSCGATWTSSTSYTLTTLKYTLDTSSPTVKYHYYTNNVKLKDNWDKMDENFPPACRTEFTGHSYWVWFVPYDESGKTGVKDGSTKRFTLKASVKTHYSSWYHWRGASEFDSNRVDYDDAQFDCSFEMPQLSRTPWGIIALKNASSYEMAHVKFFKSGEESGDPVSTLSGSYSKDQVAKQGLPEGTYTVTYDFMDPNNNTVLSSWKVQNVKVHQGRDEASATTDASTVDAVQIK